MHGCMCFHVTTAHTHRTTKRQQRMQEDYGQEINRRQETRLSVCLLSESCVTYSLVVARLLFHGFFSSSFTAGSFIHSS